MDDVQIRNELISIFDEYDIKVFKLMHDNDISVENFKEELNKINNLVLLDIRHRLTE